MNSKSHIKALFEKYVANTLDKDEYNELLQYFKTNTPDENIHRYILHMLQSNDAKVDRKALAETLARVDNKIHRHIIAEKHKAFRFRKIYPYVAAAMILIIGVSVYTYFTPSRQDNTQTARQQNNDIDPGTNKATLILGDGQSYLLSEDKQEITTDQTGIHYIDGTSIVEQTAPVIATLSTPRGGQYRLTLPDGTKVIVNSETILRYPTQFGPKDRRVELIGEAYFEVTHDKDKPFVVRGNKQEIEVLGTAFNVSDYPSEPTTTTLLTGSVKLHFKTSSISSTLTPGMQSIWNEGELDIKRVNGEDYIAWTRDLFVFNDMPLTEIMKQLERWYDIEVVYPSNFHEERFYAEIPRNRKLSEVLHSLERSGNFKFEQQGRRVMVQQ